MIPFGLANNMPLVPYSPACLEVASAVKRYRSMGEDCCIKPVDFHSQYLPAGWHRHSCHRRKLCIACTVYNLMMLDQCIEDNEDHTVHKCELLRCNSAQHSNLVSTHEHIGFLACNWHKMYKKTDPVHCMFYTQGRNGDKPAEINQFIHFIQNTEHAYVKEKCVSLSWCWQAFWIHKLDQNRFFSHLLRIKSTKIFNIIN